MAWRIAQVSAVFAAVALVVVAGWGTYSWMLESVARADAARESSRPGCKWPADATVSCAKHACVACYSDGTGQRCVSFSPYDCHAAKKEPTP